MVDTDCLEQKIKLSGKKKQYLAEKIGCTRQYFTMKCKNAAPISADEIMILCDELHITTLSEKEKIFFVKKVTKKVDRKENDGRVSLFER